uniref:Uncharacterized protein n=1 Tax=Romanomermis culicivorax TaxID=13658 RepID=A0A915L1G1_ROMCU
MASDSYLADKIVLEDERVLNALWNKFSSKPSKSIVTLNIDGQVLYDDNAWLEDVILANTYNF